MAVVLFQEKNPSKVDRSAAYAAVISPKIS